MKFDWTNKTKCKELHAEIVRALELDVHDNVVYRITERSRVQGQLVKAKQLKILGVDISRVRVKWTLKTGELLQPEFMLVGEGPIEDWKKVHRKIFMQAVFRAAVEKHAGARVDPRNPDAKHPLLFSKWTDYRGRTHSDTERPRAPARDIDREIAPEYRARRGRF